MCSCLQFSASIGLADFSISYLARAEKAIKHITFEMTWNYKD